MTTKKHYSKSKEKTIINNNCMAEALLADGIKILVYFTFYKTHQLYSRFRWRLEPGFQCDSPNIIPLQTTKHPTLVNLLAFILVPRAARPS